MSNSPLVVYTKLSPNYTPMTNKVNKKITIHHLAGDCSIETIGEIFAPTARRASSNYGIGTDGRIGMYVEEHNRSWCSSSRANDEQAITIEVANNTTAPNWTVSDKAFASLLNLCEDICRRNNIKELNFTGDKSGNLTMHKWFSNTSCPGPYLEPRFKEIADEVNRRLSAPTTTSKDEATPVDGFYHCPRGKKVKLSDNFTSNEFDCKGTNCCTETLIDASLVEYLQKIRDHFGKPVRINSAYRCPVHNSRVPNASKTSKHMYGMAADIKVTDVAPAEVAKFAESIGIRGIGLYETDKDGHFVHIDTRTSKSFWYGQAQAYRSTFGGGNETSADDILERGDRGDLVKKLQQSLLDLDYDIGQSKTDGIFGDKTEAAVIKFQKDYRITADGKVGPVTEAAIKCALEAKADDSDYGVDDFVREVQQIVGAKVDGIAGPETLSKTVTISAKVNKRHALVYPIQKRLIAMGYTSVGKADGIAGAKFTAAVKQLQQEKCKVQDGEITKGERTWKVLLGMLK